MSGWTLGWRWGEKFGYPGETRSRAAAATHWEDLIEVVWASGWGTSLGRYFERFQSGESPEPEPGHTGEIISSSWPQNAAAPSQKSVV